MPIHAEDGTTRARTGSLAAATKTERTTVERRPPLIAALATPAFAMDNIRGVGVGSDLIAIDISAAVAFWSDLETSALERVADRIDDIGAEIEININKLDHCLKVVGELLAGKSVFMLQ